MGNLITDRIAYFLKDYPPFKDLVQEDLDRITQSITVKYYEAGQFVFEENDPQTGSCFVLNKGNIKLLKAEGLASSLVDQCEPGDIFGVRSIITNAPYSMTAQCVEESLLYAIPKSLFEELFQNRPAFSTYFASGYAAGQVIVRSDQQKREVTAALVAPKLDYSREVIVCSEDTSIIEAAQIMSKFSVGSIIVQNDQNIPLGIVTDTDLRNKVLATGLDPTTSITSVMSSPVKTVAITVTLSEAMMVMIKSGFHHLVVTEDGTENSPIQGVISDHDVVLAQQNHPASLVKSIKRSNDPKEWKRYRDKTEELLKEYLDQEVKTSLVAALVTKINDTIIEKSMEKAMDLIPEAKEIDFCWLNLGSEGREEQLLRTDQDNAIVFADSHDNKVIQTTLLKLAKEVNSNLMNCGFDECPAFIMASNPKYCQPLSEWKAYFTNWIDTPDPKSVMNTTIFFDYRPGHGNYELANELGHHLVEVIKKKGIYLNFLAQNALQNPPPLSFFNNFLVERSGEHKDEFDIKKRGMMPLSDAARLLLLDHHVTGVQNTVARYQKLASLEPNHKSIFESAADAYEIFMAHRAKNGLKKGDSGRFINLKDLNKLEKQVLKNAFLSIKEVQEIISVRFQQSYFN